MRFDTASQASALWCALMCDDTVTSALKDAEKEARLELIGVAYVRELIAWKVPIDLKWSIGKLRETAESARRRAALYEDTAKQLEG